MAPENDDLKRGAEKCRKTIVNKIKEDAFKFPGSKQLINFLTKEVGGKTKDESSTPFTN